MSMDQRSVSLLMSLLVLTKVTSPVSSQLVNSKVWYWVTNSRLPRWLSGKKSISNAGSTRDAGSILGLGRFPGGRNGNPLHYSCLENSMDGGAWQATAHGVTESDATEHD